MMIRRRALTDDQAWAIVCSEDIDTVTLAARLGVKASTVRNARARYRRHGWTCRVAYIRCVHCGATVVQRGFRAGRTAYQDACRPAARAVIQARLDRLRWERMPVAERDRLLERRQAAEAEQQEATRKAATNGGARWRIEEDAYLLEHWGEPAHRAALALSRSLYAIRGRKVHLRRRGLAPASTR